MTPHDRAEALVNQLNPMKFNGRWMVVDWVEKEIIAAAQSAADVAAFITLTLVREHIVATMETPHRLHQVFSSPEFRELIYTRIRTAIREH